MNHMLVAMGPRMAGYSLPIMWTWSCTWVGIPLLIVVAPRVAGKSLPTERLLTPWSAESSPRRKGQRAAERPSAMNAELAPWSAERSPRRLGCFSLVGQRCGGGWRFSLWTKCKEAHLCHGRRALSIIGDARRLVAHAAGEGHATWKSFGAHPLEC